MSVLWFLAIILVSIFVHELGHYWAARAQGVGVKNFALGFGPTLFKFDRWNTTWRLNAVPLGGYAEVEGMQPGDTSGYARVSALGKFLILIGGVVMNLLLAWTLLAGIGSVYGTADPTDPRAQISEVVPGSLAERAGFKAGDIVVALDSQPLTQYQQVSKFRETSGEKSFTVLRNGQEQVIKFNWDTAQKQLGIRYGGVAHKTNFFTGFARAVSETFSLIPRIMKELVLSLSHILSGQQDRNVSGMVGMVNATGQAAQVGPVALLLLLANINLSLAVFNLLPIPGLDGGRIFVLLLNVLSGNRIKPETEARLAYGGFIFMLLLIVMVTINDIRNLSGS